jgi:hypothetical protein
MLAARPVPSFMIICCQEHLPRRIDVERVAYFLGEKGSDDDMCASCKKRKRARANGTQTYSCRPRFGTWLSMAI